MFHSFFGQLGQAALVIPTRGALSDEKVAELDLRDLQEVIQAQSLEEKRLGSAAGDGFTPHRELFWFGSRVRLFQ